MAPTTGPRFGGETPQALFSGVALIAGGVAPRTDLVSDHATEPRRIRSEPLAGRG